jgi:hypothetical protein
MTFMGGYPFERGNAAYLQTPHFTFFRTMPTVAAVLAGMAGIRAGTGCREQVERDLVDEKN